MKDCPFDTGGDEHTVGNLITSAGFDRQHYGATVTVSLVKTNEGSKLSAKSRLCVGEDCSKATALCHSHANAKEQTFNLLRI
jgi:hypothetical protein